MASTYLSRTFGSAGNRRTWTLSLWIKRTGIGGQQNFFGSWISSSHYERIMFNNDKIYVSDVESGSTNWELETDAVYRDTNAWYHLVLRHDTTQSTANDRVRLYVNNVQQTFGTNSQPAQNRETAINTAIAHKIGMGRTSEYTDCVMSHVHFCDGYSYAPTEFGETDSTTGEWKIKTSPSVSYGTTGFFVLKDGNSGTDQSANSNNFTVGGGTLTKTEDCPSNVFATLNPLDVDTGGSNTFSNGNNTLQTNGNGSRTTLGANSGKYYAEVKIGTNGSWNGVQDLSQAITVATNAIMLYPAGATMYISGSNQGSGGYGSAWSSNDIMMIAMDLDATQKKVYFGKNGGWWNGSAYTANAPSTGENLNNDTFYGYRCDSGSGTPTSHWNFGNGYFGTTAVSSAGTNASNLGIFEYDVPTGYKALCTKGLNT